MIFMWPRISFACDTLTSNNLETGRQAGVLQDVAAKCDGPCESFSGSDSKSLGPFKLSLNLLNAFHPKEMDQMQKQISSFAHDARCPDKCTEINLSNEVSLKTIPAEFDKSSNCKHVNEQLQKQSSPELLGKTCLEVEKLGSEWMNDVLRHHNDAGKYVGKMAEPDCSINSNFTTTTIPTADACKGRVEMTAVLTPRRAKMVFISNADVQREWQCKEKTKEASP